MKRLLFILLFAAMMKTSVFAVDVRYEAKDVKKAPEKALRERKMDVTDASQPVDDIRISTSAAASVPGTIIGETAYNYQTNDNLHDRIWYDVATGTIHTQWMYGDIAEVPGFINRRMYYNFWDGSVWKQGMGVPIETQRAGYGSLAVDKDNIAIPTSHHTITNEEATRVYFDFQSGLGFFQMSPVWNARTDGTKDLEPFWPDVAVDGNDVWYVTATNNNQDDWVRLINDVNDNIMFWRSTDRGLTWSDWIVMFPDTLKYRLTSGASGANEAGSHQVEVSDTNDGTVGVLVANPGHDFYFFESEDRGVTFKEGIQILNAPFPDPLDSLAYPIRWDVIVDLDSTTLAPVDTSLYPFTRDSEGDTLTYAEPGYHRAPHGPADLLYVNGEPHVVWNETVWIARTDGNFYYPNGNSLTWLTPYIKFLNGDSSHVEGGFSIKHWSPSTGISTIYLYDQTNDVYAGVFQQYVTMPQIGVDAAGNLYCLFTKVSDTDTLTAADGISQAETDFGPLAFGRIMGAKSTDGGATWGDVVQLTPEEDCIHQNLRYVGLANKNGNDAIHIIFQNAQNVTGTAIGGNPDHGTWVNAEIRHWAIPTSSFPTTKTQLWGPDIELVTETTLGGLDFGDIGSAGTATKVLMVKNVGDQDLVVTNAFSGAGDVFTLDPASFTVPPNSSVDVNVVFKPRTNELYDTYIALPNNDPNEFSIGFPITGVGEPTGVADRGATPSEYSLSQNYPNPFNPSTAIQFSVVKEGHVKLAVYNTLGKEVAVLIDKNMQAGTHRFDWRPKDLSSGVYFYRLTSGTFTATNKMILMQ
ncbi:T9SS C-terminal target domain-containing protein [candidate division KSB1 bacterium]|nr:T9SS type A sorting domain-containing protein [candidate division KSB1 bacterium]RQW01355.1 MAG: T9SS C-terminal target domain-containing protein [candidate division KSB1 bacterium]